MGSQSRLAEQRAQQKSLGGDVSGRHVRKPWSLQLFAAFVSLAFVLAMIVPPNGNSGSPAIASPSGTRDELQSLEVGGEFANSTARDAFSITEVRVVGAAPAAGIPDSGSAQAIALTMVSARGWGVEQFDCLVALWIRESQWNVFAHNPSSGAYGIPQALPGNKMASAGADWATNPATQITWGLGYIAARYTDPCGAWAHSEEHNWY